MMKTEALVDAISALATDLLVENSFHVRVDRFGSDGVSLSMGRGSNNDGKTPWGHVELPLANVSMIVKAGEDKSLNGSIGLKLAKSWEAMAARDYEKVAKVEIQPVKDGEDRGLVRLCKMKNYRRTRFNLPITLEDGYAEDADQVGSVVNLINQILGMKPIYNSEHNLGTHQMIAEYPRVRGLKGPLGLLDLFYVDVV